MQVDYWKKHKRNEKIHSKARGELQAKVKRYSNRYISVRRRYTTRDYQSSDIMEMWLDAPDVTHYPFVRSAYPNYPLIRLNYPLYPFIHRAANASVGPRMYTIENTHGGENRGIISSLRTGGREIRLLCPCAVVPAQCLGFRAYLYSVEGGRGWEKERRGKWEGKWRQS